MALHRRHFLKNSAIVLAGTALPMELLQAVRKKVAPSDSIRAGVIGIRGQGWSNITSMLKMGEVTCAAICDVDQKILLKRRSELEKINNYPQLYNDYRKMLEKKDIDVVIIATPDHWHCLQMTDSLSAGKDVFVEKPTANSIYESQLMVKANERYDKIVQVAQWQRSQQHFKDAIEFVQSGKLGKVSSTKAWMYRGGTLALPPKPDAEVPEGVFYDLWLGPAEKRPFNPNRFHYEFRWFWDYAGGLMTDWGVHLIDIVLEAMNVQLPRSVHASGGKLIFPSDARETPDLLTAIYDYGDFQMTWEHNMGTGVGLYGMQHGMAFIGEHGTLLLNRGGWEVRPSVVNNQPKMEAVGWQKASDHGLDKHTFNFIEAVKTRNASILNCTIEEGARAAVNAHLGNIAFRTGERIDIINGNRFFEQKKANKLMKPEYENGWSLPEKF